MVEKRKAESDICQSKAAKVRASATKGRPPAPSRRILSFMSAPAPPSWASDQRRIRAATPIQMPK